MAAAAGQLLDDDVSVAKIEVKKQPKVSDQPLDSVHPGKVSERKPTTLRTR
jgi:hypothetical protein